MKRFVACGATAFALLLVSAPAKADGSRLEAFAGYYFTEETEDDISYGARYTWDSGRGWGLMGSYETLEVDGPGYNVPGGVDAEFQQIEASWVLYLGNRHFDLFAGVGATILDVDHGIAGATVDLSDTAVSTHAGVGYRFDLGDVVYLRPEVRMRTYNIGDQTLDFTASVALGFNFGGN